MKKIIAALAALGAISGTAQAADGDPVVFKPTGPWAADFGEDYCRLARTFSDGTNQISFALERNQPGSFATMMLVGDAIRLYRRADTLGYRFLPEGNDRMGQLLRSKSADGQQILIMGGVNIGPAFAFGGPGAGGGPGAPPPGAGAPGAGAGGPPAPGTPFYNTEAEASFAAGIDGIALTAGTVSPVSIETGALDAVVTVLQDCTYDLLSYWGLDGAKHRTLSRNVVPESGTALPRGTVGFQDFAKLAGGANMVRVMVDASGKPQSCNIHQPTLGDSTNKKICAYLMENAKFMPALDADGQPMASYWISSPLFMFAPPGT